MAIARNVEHVANLKGPRGPEGEGVADSLRFRPASELPSLNVNEWLGTSLVGLYRFITATAAQAVINRPVGSDGPAFAKIEPMASGGSKVTWAEYQAPRRTFEKIISTSASNRTDWKRIDKVTRTVLHQLSMPGSPATQDTEPTRHVRLPIKVFSTIDSWELVFKNFNDRSSTKFGALDFVDVYIAKRASDGNGGYTQNFAETPTKLGTPVRYSAGATSERYLITDIHFQLEANVEYLLSYAYTTPDGTPNHMGIGGSYLGTLPAGVQSMSVSNQWSQYTPLDVYLKLEASTDVPFYVYPGSSSETGLNADYPLRDVWGWRHAEAHGAIPALIGQSGTTLDSWVGASNYIRGKFSTIARADKIIGNPGSNDIYGGNSLDVLKSRFEAFGVWARKYLGDTWEATDVFPRRTETAAVKTVRLGFNAWLKTLPSNVLLCHDRATVVSDENGLMRADFDSGDGTHLNTYGQHMMLASMLVAAGGGAPGPAGPAGPGVPTGGTAGQILRKDSTGQGTVWETLTGAVVGLGAVDNTSDANKPISTATAQALSGKADLASGRLLDSQVPERLTSDSIDRTISGQTEQFDYVKAFAARSRTNRLLLTKSSAGAGGSFEIGALSETDHITSTFNGLTGDKYHRIWETWHGALSYSYATSQSIEQRSLPVTGTWVIAEGQNAYTETVGAGFTVTLSLTGSRNAIAFRTYRDNRGGLWRFSLRGETTSQVVDRSVFAATSGYLQQDLFTEVPGGVYTLVGTFMGDDPANPPSSGAGTARGWLATQDSAGTNVNRYVLFAQRGTVSKARDTKISPVSNWDFALLIKPLNGSFQWVPEHEGIMSSVIASPPKYLENGQPLDLDSMASGESKVLTGDFELVQHIYGRNTNSSTNLIEIWTSQRFHPDGRITVTGRWKALTNLVIDAGYVLMLPVVGGIFDQLVTSIGNGYANVTDGSYETLVAEKSLATSYAFLSSTKPDLGVAVRFDNAEETMRRGKPGKPDGSPSQRAAFIDHGDSGKSKLYQQLFLQATEVPVGTVHRFSGEFARISADDTLNYFSLA